MKRNVKKIGLNRETLRRLSDQEAAAAAGGIHTLSCVTCAGNTCQTHRKTCDTCIPCFGCGTQ